MFLKRNAARVVLLDNKMRIFLVNAEDPIDPFKKPWWEIPGGGIGRGEDSAAAAARELYEETGIDSIQMGPVIWTQHVQFTFGGYYFDSYEKIHVAWGEGGEYRPQHLEALEAAAFLGARWWEVSELLQSEEPVLPTLLREHITPIISGDLPEEPIDISPAQLDEN